MPLPSLYDRWMHEMLGPVPDEPLATCSACPMSEPDVPLPAELRFDATVKCCTYLPELPNFLVGLALDDPSPDGAVGRQSLRERIQRLSGVSPLGVRMAPLYELLYERTTSLRRGGTFGRATGLRCPHYVEPTGSCGICKFRNAVCATWFCRHERGNVGLAFWTAMRNLLRLVEEEVALWSALHLGVGAGELRAVLEHQRLTVDERMGSELVDGPDIGRYWGAWDEEIATSFFVESGRLVSGMEWGQVLEASGPRILMAQGDVQERYAAVVRRAEVSDQLIMENFRVSSLRHGTALLHGYSAMDPVALPSAPLEALAAPNERVEAARLREAGMDDATIRMLLDHTILRPSSE